MNGFPDRKIEVPEGIIGDGDLLISPPARPLKVSLLESKRSFPFIRWWFFEESSDTQNDEEDRQGACQA